MNILKTHLVRLIFVLAAGAISFSCSQKTEKVVAEIGDNSISLDEYKIGYMNIIKKPDVFDSPSLREQFLDEMIRIRLVAQEAYKMKLDTNESFEYKAEAFYNKALREEHFHQVIKPKISITDDDVEVTYKFMQEERKISHLFFKLKTDADSAYSLIRNGVKFEDLAKLVFADEKLKQSGGDLGWVQWNDLDYDLAQAAFTLPVDSISHPVKSSFGYHIVKVTDFKKRPLITRTEYEQHKRKARYILEYKIGDKLALEYIHDIAGKSKVDINEETYWFVRDKLADKFSRRPSQFDQMFDLQLKEEEIQILETSLWDERNRIITTVNGKDYTIGQMMGALNYVPYEMLFKNFKAALDIIIRDFILTEEAKQMGLETAPTVVRKVKLFKDYMLQLELRRQLIRDIKVSDEEIDKYYNANRSKYKDTPYKDVYPVIKKILTGKMRREAAPNYAKSLSQNIVIKKYPEVIHEYYDSVFDGYK